MSHDRVYDRASGVNSSGGHVDMPKSADIVKDAVVYINGTRMGECTEVNMSLGTHIDEDCNCCNPLKFLNEFRDACIRSAGGPVAADAIAENVNMIATVTRCQEECTKLVQEKRELERQLRESNEQNRNLTAALDAAKLKSCELKTARSTGSVSVADAIAILRKRYDWCPTCTRGWNFVPPRTTKMIDDLTAELASVKKGRDDDEKSFELRWAADMRAVKMWQAAHPDRKDVWPDHADMVVWLMEQLKNLKNAITILADTYIKHTKLCRHNAGDLCDCNYHDMKRMWSTITGIDIRI